ncbi:MAG: hypothetical protein ACKO1N_10280 [Erythrobacter sp.]
MTPDDASVARLANAIIHSNRAIRVGSEVCAANPVVSAYAHSLRQPLAWIIRHSLVFDSTVLPSPKPEIRSALLDCARDPLLGDDELAALGDLHFYLSYFRENVSEREGQPGVDFFDEQRIEGEELRSEWKAAASAQRKTGLLGTLSSWLKPNA